MGTGVKDISLGARKANNTIPQSDKKYSPAQNVDNLDGITLSDCQGLTLPKKSPQNQESLNIPTKTYGQGIDRTEIVLLSTGNFLKKILEQNDGLCLADTEHKQALFKRLAKELPEMKEAGLQNIFIEVGVDQQPNINKFMRTGDKKFLREFPDDTSKAGVQISTSSYCHSFFEQCRDLGINIFCMDVSSDRINSIINKYDSLGVGNVNLQKLAFKDRAKTVGEEQTKKELEEFTEIRFSHNKDWMKVVKGAFSTTPESGKFLIIGGSAHFLKTLNGTERLSINDQLKELGKSSLLIELSLSENIEPLVTKNKFDFQSGNFAADYSISYPVQNYDSPPTWAKAQLTQDLNNGKINYKEYQTKIKNITASNQRLMESIAKIKDLVITPDDEIWNDLPADYPLKSENSLNLASNIKTLHSDLKNLLNKETAEYIEIIKLINQLDTNIKTYREGANLREYVDSYYEKTADNPNPKEQVVIESHIFTAMIPKLSDARIAAHTLLLIKRSYAEVGHENLKESIREGLEAAQDVFILSGSEIWNKLPDDHPAKSKENVNLAKNIQDAITPLLHNMPFMDYNEAQTVMERCSELIDSYAGGADNLLEYIKSSEYSESSYSYLSRVLEAHNHFNKAADATNQLLTRNEEYDKKTSRSAFSN